MAVDQKTVEIALRIKAQTEQARAELQVLKSELAGIDSASAKRGATSAAASKTATAAAEKETAAVAAVAAAHVDAAEKEVAAVSAVTTAQTARAETEDEARARISAMVDASLAAIEADKARTASIVESSGALHVAADANSAYAKSSAELAAAQTATMQAYTTSRASVAELQTLLAKRKLTTEDVAKAEALLDRAQAAGIISAGELAEAFAALDAAKVEDIAVTKVQTATSEKAILSSRAASEIGTAASEVLAGNFGRLRRTGAAFANQAGLISKLMSPLGLAIVGVGAAVGALAAAFMQGEAESTAFNKAIILTGNYAGQTVGQLENLSREAADVTGTTQHAAAAVAAQVAASGKFYGDMTRQVTEAALAMQRATGQSVDKTIQQFAQLGDDPVKAVLSLNDATHFLTQAIYDQITALVQRGQNDEAAKVAQKAYADATIARAKAVQQNLGDLETVWNSVAGAAKGAWDAMLDVGRTETPETRIAKLRDALAAQEKLLANAGKVSTGGTGAAGGADLGGLTATIPASVIKANIARIKQQINQALTDSMFEATATRTAALHQRLTGEALTAQQSLASGAGISNQQALQTRLDALAVQKTKALYGVTDPAKRQQIIDAFNLQVADAARKYNAAEKKLAPKSSPLDHAQTNAAVAAAQTAAKQVDDIYANGQKVLNAQHKAALVNDAAYYDAERGMLTEWENGKVAALEKEKVAAQSHLVTQADRVKADQKVAQIDAEIANVHADATAKRLALDAQEQQALASSQKAWESLRRSMETPVNAKIDAAIDKIQQLNKMLALGAGDSTQYHELLKEVGENSVTDLPKYHGLHSAVGGIGSELTKNYAKQKAQDEKYEQEKLALKNKYRHDDESQEEAYQAALTKLDKQHADRTAQIEQARGQLQLQTASDVFGQLATLSTSHNRKMAAIGKAAAIAQTVIKTYQSATEAYAALAGIPYIGPELGAAAAAVAIAAGLANVAAIRSQSTGGYAEGGYTGPGGKYQVAGLVHAGEGVLSQRDIAALGGPGAFLDFQRGLRGYADGGFVHPMANAPTPAQLGFSAPSQPRVRMSDFAANDDAHARQAQPAQTHIHVWSMEQAAQELAKVPSFSKAIIHVVGDNPRTIQGKWQAG